MTLADEDADKKCSSRVLNIYGPKKLLAHVGIVVGLLTRRLYLMKIRNQHILS